MITETLMGPGTGELELDPSTPDDVKAIGDQGFNRVVITATHQDVEPGDEADIIAMARWSGLFRARTDDRCRWKGAHLSILLGDEDGKANTHTVAAEVAALPKWNGPSNPSWIRNKVLRSGTGGANGITAGDIPVASSPTKAGNLEVGDPPLDILDWVCDVFSTTPGNPEEYRVNDDGTLDQGPRQTLWPTTVSPTAVAVRATAGGATDRNVIPIVDFGNTDDWSEWTSALAVTGPTVPFFDDEWTYFGEASVDPNPFVGIDGDPLVMRRVISSNKAKSDADNEAAAERRLARTDAVIRRPTIATDMFDLGELVRVGDSFWLFDPATGLYNLDAEGVPLGAETVYPLVIRLVDTTWPVRDGMGVYVIPQTGLGAWGSIVDLTPHMVFETGKTRMGVGTPRRGLPRLRGTRRLEAIS